MNDLHKNDDYWMRYALRLADRAWRQGEVPVGAVVVHQGVVVGEGWNQSISTHDPSAHAEMIALRQAARRMKNYRLVDCDIYVTIEPCSMCAGAMQHARIARLVYGAPEPKGGAVRSNIGLLAAAHCTHRVDVAEPIMTEVCQAQIQGFFRWRRRLKKQAKRQAKIAQMLAENPQHGLDGDITGYIDNARK